MTNKGRVADIKLIQRLTDKLSKLPDSPIKDMIGCSLIASVQLLGEPPNIDDALTNLGKVTHNLFILAERSN